MNNSEFIKSMVNNNQKVYFQFYRSGELYYRTENGFSFRVPINDVGDATFGKEEKAILLMRWIRKEIEATENWVNDDKNN